MVVLLAVVALVFWIVFQIKVVWADTDNGWSRVGFGLLSLVVTGAITAFAVMLVVALPNEFIARAHRAPVTYEMASLQDGHSPGGSFFLGSGTIHDVPSYMYYLKGNDGYFLDSVAAYKMTVKEEVWTQDFTPHVTFMCKDYSAVPSWFNWPFAQSKPDSLDDCYGRSTTGTFYVPKDSIKSQYVLDAK